MSEDQKIEKSKEELEKLKEEAERCLNNWKRAQADLENYKKEIEKEKEEWIKFANLSLVIDLLPILDNLRKAIDQFTPSLDSNQQTAWIEGVKNIKKQFEDLLKKIGVEEIKISPEEKFNPEIHQAVGKERIEGKEKGIILKELERGYRIYQRIIRPTKVVINE